MTATGNSIVIYQIFNPGVDSEYEWTITNGSIIEGQYTNMVQIQWTDEDLGTICIIETDIDGCSNSPFCLEVELSPSSIYPVNFSSIGIYQNPSNNMIYLEQTKPFDIKNITIYNMLGQSVLVTDYYENGINISALPSASYIIKIKTESQNINSKFIKN